MKNKKAKRDSKILVGFTLVELLVVMSIIGILIGAMLVAYQGTRATARDGKRKADLEQIRMALQMYHADCRRYPSSSVVVFGNPLIGPTGTPCAGNTYMSQLPADPNPSYSYRYEFVNDHTYNLCAKLETTGTSPCSTGGCSGNCGTDITCDYFTCQP